MQLLRMKNEDADITHTFYLSECLTWNMNTSLWRIRTRFMKLLWIHKFSDFYRFFVGSWFCSSQVPDVANVLWAPAGRPEGPEQPETETDEAAGSHQPGHPGSPAQVIITFTSMIHCWLWFHIDLHLEENLQIWSMSSTDSRSPGLCVFPLACGTCTVHSTTYHSRTSLLFALFQVCGRLREAAGGLHWKSGREVEVSPQLDQNQRPPQSAGRSHEACKNLKKKTNRV